MSDDTTSGNGPNDPFEGLAGMMGNIPGGEYFLQMVRNNPEVRTALESMDPNDPDSAEHAMRVLLGAFGVAGPQAEMMMGMMKNAMNDPSQMASMMGGMGGAPGANPFGGPNPFGGDNPFGGPNPFGAGGPAAPADAPTKPPVAPATPDPAPAAPSEPETPALTGPPWAGVAERASDLINEGSERSGFRLLTETLDHDHTSAYDPRADTFAELTAVLEVFAAEAKAAGRQIPLRFGDLYARLAMHYGAAESRPDTNPAFTDWAARIVEAASRPH